MPRGGVSLAMWLRTAIVAALWVCACELVEYSAVRREPGEFYPLGFAWRLAWWGFLAGSLSLIGWTAFGPSWGVDSHRLELGAILLGIVLFMRPRSVTVGPTGVSSCAIFGLFRRYVPWTEVSEVAYDWEDLPGRLRPLLWWLPGSRITVRSRIGRQVQHTIFNRRQGAFLDALRRYLPREAFAPGVYDWHP